jgi:hypothetical protein
MALAQSLEVEPRSRTSWTVGLRPGRPGGRLTFEFSDGFVRFVLHQQPDGIDVPAGTIQRVTSARPDARDLLEVWWWGESQHTRQKALAYRGLGWLRRLTGRVVSPWVNVVFRKTA